MTAPRRRPWIAIFGAPILALYGLLWAYDQRPLLEVSQAQEPDRGVAVVELFTSEGCSSCPPADHVLAELDRQAAAAGRPVYVLAYHVDYWDHLGWADPFATPRWSQRQRKLARRLRTRSVYTPMMVVNGKEAFVGSRRSTAREKVERALSRPATAKLTLATRLEDGRYRLTYAVEGAPQEAVVEVAVVERGLVSQVTRGENRGETLEHHDVVRSLESTKLLEGDLALRVPQEVVVKNARVVVTVRGPGAAVLGAARIDLR